MSFKPCFLIPIYNHKDSIRDTVRNLADYHMPIFIVDDGSNVATKRTLAALSNEYSAICLFSLPHNAGKGAAVMHGMREAHKAGHTHALQIDADGQHDTTDVPLFLECGASSPNALICGKPFYDASAPRGRLYGRYITHFWIWIETLSFAIGDSMCGFRLYPLAKACALIDSVHLPTRMDFDPEILVRLAWRGVQFENIPTRVIYPKDGLSHFNMLRDNLRISMMHTRLTFGMLLRLPVLIWRKIFPHRSDGGHWSTISERGSAIGMRAIFICYRLLGETTARLLLYPVVAYFFLTGKKIRNASRDYLRRVKAHGSAQWSTRTEEPGSREVFQHMLAFAQSGLDKLAAWMGGFDGRRVEFDNRSEFEQLLCSGKGAVLIGSHLGNLEMTRALATDDQRAVVNAIVYTHHAKRFNAILTQANGSFGTNLIQVSHLGPETAIILKEKIDHGELIVIVGDRTPPDEAGENKHVSKVNFLGYPAPFAEGPLILASLLECPVYLFFCLREGDRYQIYFEPFAERIELPRRERKARLQIYLQQYALRLEAYCHKAPFQWFNFYDFWQQSLNKSDSNL